MSDIRSLDLGQRGKSLNVSDLHENVTTGPATAGTYNTTDVFGFNVINAGSAGNWVLTYTGGGVSTIAFGDMITGYFPAHLSSIVIPTGGIAELYIP